MKQIGLIFVVTLLMASPLYSDQPIVTPDLDYLPALLDSTIHIRWEFDGNERILEDRRIYTYDTYGNLKTSEININNNSLSVNTYDEKGNQIENIYYEWDSDINDWVEYGKENWSYDENGNQIENIYYEWDSGINDWIRTWKETWSYDENGNQIENIYYEWDSGIYDWVGNYQMVDTYNPSGLITGRIKYEWDPDGEEWRITAEYFAYWSELGTRIPVRTENQQIIIYPNPTNTFLTIESDIPDIYNIIINSQNGQLLFNREMEGTTHQLDLSSFQNGIYFITIRSKDSVTTRKIVKL